MAYRPTLKLVSCNLKPALLANDSEKLVKRTLSLADEAQITIKFLWELANVPGAHLGVVEPFYDLAYLHVCEVRVAFIKAVDDDWHQSVDRVYLVRVVDESVRSHDSSHVV